MSGTLQDLTAEQADALRELKTRVRELLKKHQDDHLLLRFLRARKFDVKKADDMFRKDVAWRTEHRIDTIQEWYKIPEVCLKYYPGGAIGLDKEGHIIWLSPIGNIDAKGLLYSVKASDFINTSICIMERMENEQKIISKKLGRHIEGMTLIFDLENLGASHIWKPAIAAMGEIMGVMESHYPCFIYQLFLIRPTKVFPAVYFALKPFLGNETVKRVRLLGSNWREVLLTYIDADVLPVHWGGNMTDPDGNPNMCPSKINLGGKIPKSFYRKDTGLNHPDMTSVEIHPNKSTEVKLKVLTHGSILRYEFKTKSHDMSFGIYRQLAGGEKVTVLTQRRYNSHIVPEDGEVLFDQAGLYIVRFDNKGTFHRTRKLDYWMEVVEPKIDDQDVKDLGAGDTRDSILFQDDSIMKQLSAANP